jgi:ribose transport system ATP-binding protein
MARLSDTTRLSMRGLRKRFGATVALDGVDLDVEAGEVHALLGENGAGKSTLMKILAGAVVPDAGSIVIDGVGVEIRTPRDAQRHAIAMIHQELVLAPHLTVVENLRLGRERATTLEDARSALADLEIDVDPFARVGRLAPPERQLVEIARALVARARIVVLDEPTSSLGAAEIERVFAVVERLRALGAAVVFIGHHLDEVRRAATNCTILRDGRTVHRGPLADLDDRAVIEHMAGRPIARLHPHERRAAARTANGPPTEVVLAIDACCGDERPVDASLALLRGEIFGIAGLVGAGRTELLRTLVGLDRLRTGTVRVSGRSIGVRSIRPRTMLAAGVGLLSEDRAGEGVALRESIAVNITLSSLERSSFSGRIVPGLLRRSDLAARALGWFERLAIKARDPEQAAIELSGGNQQKVALARLLEHDVEVLLLDEPTRGIDVGSRERIYAVLDEIAAAGKAVLVVSSVADELLGLCDRIAVMHDGVLGPARPASEWSRASILAAASGLADLPEGNDRGEGRAA